jgi:hypothetical protein
LYSIAHINQKICTLDESKKNRPIRPCFAEDGIFNFLEFNESVLFPLNIVYGAARQNTTSTNSAAVDCRKDIETQQHQTTEICGSALAQRRSANLPKLKELSTSCSNDLNTMSTEWGYPLAVGIYINNSFHFP